jgi:hypothetical protein
LSCTWCFVEWGSIGLLHGCLQRRQGLLQGLTVQGSHRVQKGSHHLVTGGCWHDCCLRQRLEAISANYGACMPACCQQPAPLVGLHWVQLITKSGSLVAASLEQQMQLRQRHLTCSGQENKQAKHDPRHVPHKTLAAAQQIKALVPPSSPSATGRLVACWSLVSC